MMTRKLLAVFSFFFIIGTKPLLAQLPTYPLILNELNVSNVPPGIADEKGGLNDYVEIYNNHTEQIFLSQFYLSNDKNNLFKWRFPANFPPLKPGDFALVWLSGRNTNDGINFHTNFNIEQCKGQYIILTKMTNEVYDSVYVLPTKAGHVRGRVDRDNRGITAWRLFSSPSPKFANGNPSGVGYAPTPQIFLSNATAQEYSSKTNTGKFVAEGGAQLAFLRLQGRTYDSTSSCFHVYYTVNGDYPVPFWNGSSVSNDGNCFLATEDTTTGIPVSKTSVIRAISVPKPAYFGCSKNTLPSFCESNTYFIDPEYNTFSPEFGVISIALDQADKTWFDIGGTPPASIHVEYYDGKKQVTEGYAMINRPPNEEWRTEQKGFYINKDDRMGFGCNFEGNIFNVEELGKTERRVFPTLHLKGGDYESHSESGQVNPPGTSYGTGLRDLVMQTLAAKYDLHVGPLHAKPVVAFVNGDYWGVYNLSEVYDKYYEEFYNGQPLDKVDLHFVHNCLEGSVSSWDGSVSSYGPTTNFRSSVYNISQLQTIAVDGAPYQNVMSALDKASFIDYMILNSYGMNSDITGSFCNNVTLAKGWDASKPGFKWHFYLWNMPSIFNFSVIAPTGNSFINPAVSPCYLYNPEKPVNLYNPTLNAFNGHGNLMTRLMSNKSFKNEYITRYQDLLNGPLKCDNILKHFDYVSKLYEKEMRYHEDVASLPVAGKFTTSDPTHTWDSNMVALRKVIQLRCFHFVDNAFKTKFCYEMNGPFQISVDVRPAEAGKVRVNTTLIDQYTWYGDYYQQNMRFKAIPTSENDYVFHHWEINGPASNDPLSMDSINLNLNISGNITAVFTDKRNDIAYSGENPNLPTGFTPNGDGLNDDFRPLGTGEFATDYQMLIFNRWGQQVFRSVDPFVGWNGRFGGQDAQTGVYAYVITYKNVYNEEKILRGNVTLTR